MTKIPGPQAGVLPELLQIGPVPPGLVQLLTPHYRLYPLWKEPHKTSFLQVNQGRFVGGVTMSRHGATAEVMACLKGKVLACFGVGFEGLDLHAAREHHVAVSTTPDVLTQCVADLALGLMLATARQIVAADRFVQAGLWQQGPYPMATSVYSKRLGIVGLGRIGAAIARRADGFDMIVRYHGTRQRENVIYHFEPDLLALASWADFLVIACRGGPSTHHLISSEVLKALGPKGFLINIARGSIIDEHALVEAVTSGQIAGAGLDVFAQEPQVPIELLKNDRFVVLPHIGVSTYETRSAMEKLVADNLSTFFQTGHVLTPPS